MTGRVLTFRVRSGGTVSIDLDRCPSCSSKACVQVCQKQGGPLALDEAGRVPALRMPLSEIARGGCVECLGCELDCALYGCQAIVIELPLARFEEYLSGLAESVVYKRGR